jgi:DNA-binding transcriptional ArsR family regulator
MISTNENANVYEVGEVIIIPKDFEENKALILNNVAAYIWKKLDYLGGVSIPDLVKSILDNFDVKQEALEKDLKIFLEILNYMNLISADDISFEGIPKYKVEESDSKEIYRIPKIYVYDLTTDDEVAFGPHIKGRTYVHRAITKSWHGGCC